MSKKRNRRNGASAITRKLRFLKYAIENNNFDIRNFDRIIEANPEIREDFAEMLEDYPPFEELQQDVYSSLYKYSPQLRSLSKMDSDYVLNQQIMEMLMDTEQYRELRLVTKFDEVNSTVGTEILSEEIKNILDEIKDEFEDMLEQLKQAQKQVQQMEGDGEGEGQGQIPGQPGDGDEEGEGAMTLEQVQRVMEETKEKLQKEFRESEDVSLKMYNAMKNAVSGTREVSDLIHQWGLNSDPGFSKAPYQEKIKLIDKIKSSRKLRELSVLAGRFKKLATKKKKMKVKKVNTDIQDVELGNDLTNIVAGETALLKGDTAKMLFYKKYVDRELVQYKHGGKYSLGKGPIVACIDTSGSMSGEAEVFSKAVALGLLEIARDQKRDFHVMHFDSRPAEEIHTNTFLHKDAFSVDEVIDMAEYFGGGGTDFEEPLKLAREKIDEDPDFEKSDIVFITDGQSAVRDDFEKDFNEWKEERNVNVYSVLINMSYSSETPLQLFSDNIVPLNTMKRQDEDGGMDDVAEGIFDSLK